MSRGAVICGRVCAAWHHTVDIDEVAALVYMFGMSKGCGCTVKSLALIVASLHCFAGTAPMHYITALICDDCGIFLSSKYCPRHEIYGYEHTRLSECLFNRIVQVDMARSARTEWPRCLACRNWLSCRAAAGAAAAAAAAAWAAALAHISSPLPPPRRLQRVGGGWV